MKIVKAQPETIAEAARIIKAGGLVAFPTETVYGLGGNALDEKAVARIYQIKNRPADNPMILHIHALSDIADLVLPLTEAAQRLAEAFWPGSLTMVLPKKTGVPEWIGGHPSGKTETVAVRMPSHETALALIAASGCVIAAPSANLSGRPSPTEAAHVAEDFEELEGLLLDGGSASGGLESTVVDMTGSLPQILRPGAVTAEMLSAALSQSVLPQNTGTPVSSSTLKSPGMKYRHYAPQAEMTVVTGSFQAVAERIAALVEEALLGGKTPVGIMATSQTAAFYRARFVVPEVMLLMVGDRDEPQTVAHNLYATLRRFDALGVKVIFAEGIAESGVGLAVMNRMTKAAGGKVIGL